MKLVIFSSKLCHISSTNGFAFASGGFPAQMRALSQLFDETEVVLPCIDSKDTSTLSRLDGPGLRVVRLSRPPRGGIWQKLMLPWWLLRNLRVLWNAARRADAIHTPVPGDIGMMGIILALIRKQRLMVRYCGKWPPGPTLSRRLCGWLMETFGDRRRIMFAMGEQTAHPSKRNPEVRWTFATSLTDADLEALREFRKLPREGVLRIAFVGRLEQGKRADLILRALPMVAASIPTVALDVVGEGSHRPALELLAKSCGVAERVKFHGLLSARGVLEVLQGAHLFCFPTEAEGFGKAVVEALACGLPVVSSPIPVMPSPTGDGCGIVVVDGTPRNFADALVTCLSDETRYEAMSRRAIERAKGFSLECWRDGIGEALREAWGELKGSEATRGGGGARRADR